MTENQPESRKASQPARRRKKRQKQSRSQSVPQTHGESAQEQPKPEKTSLPTKPPKKGQNTARGAPKAKKEIPALSVKRWMQYATPVRVVLEEILASYGEGAVDLTVKALNLQRTSSHAKSVPQTKAKRDQASQMPPLGAIPKRGPAARALGRSMPSSMEPVLAIRQATAMGCTALQIFLGNPETFRPTWLKPPVTKACVRLMKQSQLHPVVIHASLMINLATKDESVWKSSCGLLQSTIIQAIQLQATYVVMHLGRCDADQRDQGIGRLIEGIVSCWPPPATKQQQVHSMLLLENSYGKKGSLGSSLQELGVILRAFPTWGHDRIGVCLDTAHLWSAGYDLTTPEAVREMVQILEEQIGSQRVKVIHLNDSVNPLGSGKDQHARWGEGLISSSGLEGLRALMKHPSLAHVAFILETPVARDEANQLLWSHDQVHFDLIKQIAQH